jgi:hypothetical protein
MQIDKSASSWWTTVPGMITAVAGLLTAVATLIAALHAVGLFEGAKPPSDQVAGPKSETPVPPPIDNPPQNAPERLASYTVPGMNGGEFVEKDGHLVSRQDGRPLCPTPPGWRMGCTSLEPQYRQDWHNTPDGYVAGGKKVKTFTNRSERVFQILGTKNAFYVDDGFLYDYPTATILCPWPKAGVALCHALDVKYQDRWRNTPNGFVADGREFDRDEVVRQVRGGFF